MRNTMLALVLVAALPACYQTTVRTGAQMSGEVHTQTSHIFIEGLVGGHVTPPCEPAQIVTKQTFVNMLIGGLTAGLYTPTTVTTTCAIRGAATAAR